MARKKHVACAFCQGAPKELQKYCNFCKGSTVSSQKLNEAVLKYESDYQNINTSALMEAVRCMGFNPVRLSMLFGNFRTLTWAFEAAIRSINLHRETLAKHCITDFTTDALQPDEGLMKEAIDYFLWAKRGIEADGSKD